MVLAAVKEVKLGDEIFESSEVKAEVEAAKRRSRFRFSMVGITPGTELQLFVDPTIICTTVDDANKSISKATLHRFQMLCCRLSMQ